MGLSCEFTVIDLGYPERTSELGLFIDYGPGCQLFADKFYEYATSLVPVDTGYLQSTIYSSSDQEGCVCGVDCEYAEYVEYGTIYMSAQPYFEPALYLALQEAAVAWMDALQLAQEEEAQLLEEMEEMEAERPERGLRDFRTTAHQNMWGGGFGGFLGTVIALFIVAIVDLFMNIIFGLDENYSSGSHGFGGSFFEVDDLLGGSGGEGLSINIT